MLGGGFDLDGLQLDYLGKSCSHLRGGAGVRPTRPYIVLLLLVIKAYMYVCLYVCTVLCMYVYISPLKCVYVYTV